MTDDEILQALDCEYPFPREALLAASANRATIGPRLITEIDHYVANPGDDSHRPQRLFFAFHLLAEWREKAAYRPLCRLTRLEADGHEVIGGALTETGPRVLASVFDGDPQPLYELIHDEGADEFARAMGCEALAMVSARGELPIGEAERFLRESFETLRPRDINYVWSGWQEAIGILGLESLVPLVHQAFASFIDPTWTEFKFFEQDLRDALATDCAAAKGSDRRRTLFDDTVGELSGWYCFSEAHQRELRLAASRSGRISDRTAMDGSQSEPHVNPYRHVGRNDPCPCGSGLKFKRCHGKS